MGKDPLGWGGKEAGPSWPELVWFELRVCVCTWVRADQRSASVLAAGRRGRHPTVCQEGPGDRGLLVPLVPRGQLSQGLALWLAPAWGRGSVWGVGRPVRSVGRSPGPSREGCSEPRGVRCGLCPVRGRGALPGPCRPLPTDGHPAFKALRARSRPHRRQVPWPSWKLTPASPPCGWPPPLPGTAPTLPPVDLVGR